MFIASAASQNINTLAPEPDIPVAQARLVVEDILNAPANRLIPGLMALVLVRQHINTLVPALDTPVAQAPPVVENILNVPVLPVINGIRLVEHVRLTILSAKSALCIIVTTLAALIIRHQKRYLE